MSDFLISNLHNLIFHLVSVMRQDDFRLPLLRASGPNDPARKILGIRPDLTEEDVRVLKVIVFMGDRVCEQISLPATQIAIAALKALSEEKTPHLESYVAGARAAHDALWRELMEKSFFWCPDGKIVFVRRLISDWGNVFVAMPQIEADIRSAVNCFSFGQNMACVFHLMRAMELGVRRFAKRLKVNIVQTQPGRGIRELTWHQILDAMNPALRSLPQATQAQKRKAEQIRAAQSYLYGVKEAWRNPVMHPSSEGYSDRETEAIIRQVQAFMNQLVLIIAPGRQS